jgi:hypothetical protein
MNRAHFLMPTLFKYIKIACRFVSVLYLRDDLLPNVLLQSRHIYLWTPLTIPFFTVFVLSQCVHFSIVTSYFLKYCVLIISYCLLFVNAFLDISAVGGGEANVIFILLQVF